MQSNNDQKFDVVLYGATGFTGRQTAEYFQQHAPAGLRFAIAGRNQNKLEALHKELGLPESVGVIAADSADAQAIDAMVARTRVLLTTAGPYTLYGEHLVRACAEQGVHYVDITGETAFIRDMIDRYAKAAEKSAAKLVPLCGFDSVPADLGAYLAQKRLRDQHQTGTVSARGYYSIGGGFNGGTFFSGLTMFETGAHERMRDVGLLLPEAARGVAPPADNESARYEADVDSWVAPFVMGRINTRVVHRSAALAAAFAAPYGAAFGYGESLKMGGRWNPVPAVAMASGMQAFEALGTIGAVRNVLKMLGPAPGAGPSDSAIENGFYQIEVVAAGENGTRVRTTIADERDPGNRATVQFVCEAAFALAGDLAILPGGAERVGFLTPATAFGDVLVDRLIAGGTTIQSEDL
ncbi:MAG: saccharopine dehydrogenase NADP-binding domain-containing protein [bacterium]|nr:saccharopine dehydrogenase NADP-binding domain-containing protein [bacterium]